MGMPVSRSISASSSMKRKPRSVASLPAERGLAGAAQSDQGDPVAPRGFFLAVVAHQPEDHVLEPVARQLLEDAPHQPLLDRLFRPDAQQLGQRQPEGVADVAQQHDRDVALAGLEVGEMAFRHPRLACQLLAGLAAPVPRLADALAEREEELAIAARIVPDAWVRECRRGLGCFKGQMFVVHDGA